MRNYALLLAGAAALVFAAPRLSAAMPSMNAGALETAAAAVGGVEKTQYYGYYGLYDYSVPYGYYGYYQQPYVYYGYPAYGYYNYSGCNWPGRCRYYGW